MSARQIEALPNDFCGLGVKSSCAIGAEVHEHSSWCQGATGCRIVVVSLSTAKRLGVHFAMHSDAPITPIGPLFTAWCAVNRRTSSGRVLGEVERISVADALHAVTLGAAYTLKMDHEVGSLEVGKRADFAVLETDPLTEPPEALKDIPVWGTVLGGRIQPAAPA